MSAGMGMEPDERVRALSEIDIAGLGARGIRGILVDLDNTCVPRGTDEVPEGVTGWFADAAGAGMLPMVVSNNFDAGRVRRFAEAVGVSHSFWALKPLPFSLLGAARRLGVDPSETVMIGDQPYTDVLAGNLAGMLTILVEPQAPDAEPRYTKLMRRLFSAGGGATEAAGECVEKVE